MNRKLLCLCAAVALLFAISTANVASAQEGAPAAPAACPCEFAPAAVPCQWACKPAPWVKGCPPVVTYRVGPFGAIRPVVHTPVHRPVYVAPRLAPWYAHPAYVVPSRVVVPHRAWYW